MKPFGSMPARPIADMSPPAVEPAREPVERAEWAELTECADADVCGRPPDRAVPAREWLLSSYLQTVRSEHSLKDAPIGRWSEGCQALGSVSLPSYTLCLFASSSTSRTATQCSGPWV